MFQFISDVQQHAFLQNALLTGLLASIACGVIGTYVVVRRVSYIAGGISHSVLGGIGASLYFKHVYQWDFLHPIYGALVVAMAAAVTIGIVSLRVKEREDTVIGAFWAVGMATGILFISRTPGYSQDLMSYLFGNILLVTKGDLWLLALLDGIVVGTGLLLYNQLMAVCFDNEFARIRGLRVELYYMLLLCLTALSVVVLATVVGVVMVIALLTLPIAIASQFTRTLWSMMAVSTLLSAILTTSGLVLSYGPDYPAGATTILLAGAAYLLVGAIKWLVIHCRY